MTFYVRHWSRTPAPYAPVIEGWSKQEGESRLEVVLANHGKHAAFKVYSAEALMKEFGPERVAEIEKEV